MCRRKQPAGSVLEAEARRCRWLGALPWDWHWLQKHSDIGLCAEQRAAARVSWRWVRFMIWRKWNKTPTHPTLNSMVSSLSSGIVSEERCLGLVAAMVCKSVFKERIILLGPISQSPSVLPPSWSCELMWIECSYRFQLTVFMQFCCLNCSSCVPPGFLLRMSANLCWVILCEGSGARFYF